MIVKEASGFFCFFFFFFWGGGVVHVSLGKVYWSLQTVKVMFSSLLVCLIICLSVSNVTGKRIFIQVLKRRYGREQGAYWNILDVPLTPWIHCGFTWGGPCLSTTLRTNEWMEYHEIFRISRISDFWGMSCLTPGSRINLSIFWIRVC